MKIKHTKQIKNIRYWISCLVFAGIFSGCDTEGDLVGEETYVTVRNFNFTKIGDSENELGFYINGDSLRSSGNYYPEGTELNIELKKKKSGEVLLDSTRTAVFGEDIVITAFYTGDIVIPMEPLTDKEREPAPEGYKKVRFINFIKNDKNVLEGKNLRFEVYGIYNTELNAANFYNEAMTEEPVYIIENISPDDFTSFINIPELETISVEVGQELKATAGKIFDADSGELLSDVYAEEGELFPGFPSFGMGIVIRGERNVGNLNSSTGGTVDYDVTTFQLFQDDYGGYKQRYIESLSE
ncbi:hypothetical protein [Sinomicrobium weinanense]|uniref:Uncharacterized protein n=1 Tax=Sinomicrobium weinanense TaxID=2842200 RepID=A0A926JTY0_9FLAO|nr:hypothetical protein [Sinomicrobium weinanense]MBC9797193.1 hypothetical protein [Sinomicrobium weinanense]MBU3122743.1 hypothetical protein [Sinomicrobium weinanense]